MHRLESWGPLALVVLLHAAVLAWLYQVTIQRALVPELLRMDVRTLHEPPPPPPEKPKIMPAKPVPAPQRQVVAPPTPVLTAEPTSIPGPAFTVPPQPPAPPRDPPAAAVIAAPAPWPVTAPRFNAEYLNNPPPVYPGTSRRLREEGRVLLQVRVTAQGLPDTVEIRQSSGFARLDEAALAAVTQWRFVPARRGDEPISASVLVPVDFRLQR